MAKRTNQLQKTRERKRRKRAQAKVKARAHAEPTNKRLEYMRHAGRRPLRHCLISCDWRGFSARIVVARDTPGGIAAALFTLDRGCRGVTDALSIPVLSKSEYVSLLDDFRSMAWPWLTLQPDSLDLAAKLIEAAVDYGTALGFKPPRGFREAKQLLHGASPDQCPENVRCGGPGGRPMFSPDKDEDPEPVLRKLTARLGVGGFDYVPPYRSTSPLHRLRSQHNGRPPILRFDGEELLADSTWRRLRATQASLTERVIEYGAEELSDEMLDYAWCDFDPGSTEMVFPDDDARYYGWFLPWVAFAWRPFDELGYDDDLEPDRATWPKQPLGLELLRAQRNQLDPIEQRFLQAVCARPYSFYQVADIEPEQALALEDLLTGKRWRVNERAGTRSVQRHGIFYARILPLDDHAIIESGGPFQIPSNFARPIRELGNRIRGGRDTVDERGLHDRAPDLHDLHLKITDHLEFSGEVVG